MNIIYNNFSKNVLQGVIQPENEVFKMALFTENYNPSSDVDTLYSQIHGYETTANGYIKGGQYISISKLGRDSDYMRYSGSVVKWTSNNLACRYAVLYIESTGMLAACYDLGEVHLNDVDNILTLDWSNSYLLSFRMTLNMDLNARKIRDDIYQYILTDPTEELKKSMHDYIIENSDTELDEESPNTIQNKGILGSTSGMENSDIDSLFD